MHSSNQTLQKITILTGTKHNRTSAQLFFFNWNRPASVIGHKQGTVDCPQRKPFPRSTANSTVRNSTRHDTVP